MEIYVYIIECSDKSFYTGITWNLQKRILEHNNGLNVSTKSRIPVELVYWEEFPDRMSAAKREKEIKGWSRIKKSSLIEKFTLSRRSR
jgi:putative endonuclease